MTWIELGNPAPKNGVDEYSLFQWRTGEVQRLAASVQRESPAFLDVTPQRRSSRQFEPLGDDGLAEFLWYACRSHSAVPSEMGFELEHRIAPSAGAIHPIHVLVSKAGDSRWWLYEPKIHFLIEVPNATQALEGLHAHSRQVVKADDATQLLLLAEPGKTLAKYNHGCSLIWRDAGVLIGVMALTAQALDLHFCPLGITGEPWASKLSEQGQLAGVGLALLGSAPTGSY